MAGRARIPPLRLHKLGRQHLASDELRRALAAHVQLERPGTGRRVQSRGQNSGSSWDNW